jgi:nucleotide-binding universal stress UspA family protein
MPFRSILVPTDFSQDAHVAFAHALRLALAANAEHDVLHVEPWNDQADWHWAPAVTDTLARWDFVRPGASAADLEKLGIRARRTMAVGERPESAILEEMAASHADLLVLSTLGRAGLARWLQPSVVSPVLRKRPVPMLLLPAGSRGFVDVDSGETRLRRILLPIDRTPNPAPGFDVAVGVAHALGGDDVQLATLHVGDAAHPEVELLRPKPGWKVMHWTSPGAVVDEVLETANHWDADLIVAVSEGRRGWLDGVRGSTIERLWKRTRAPILVVPADWGARDISET